MGARFRRYGSGIHVAHKHTASGGQNQTTPPSFPKRRRTYAQRMIRHCSLCNLLWEIPLHQIHTYWRFRQGHTTPSTSASTTEPPARSSCGALLVCSSFPGGGPKKCRTRGLLSAAAAAQSSSSLWPPHLRYIRCPNPASQCDI